MGSGCALEMIRVYYGAAFWRPVDTSLAFRLQLFCTTAFTSLEDEKWTLFDYNNLD